MTGPQGEEIYTDKYARIKVQFHWDQEGQYDENSSCWIRVNQGWAGKGWGNLFIPRIGQEVIVSFLNGDPDTPVVTGAVYNSQQIVPYPLPDEQTRSTIKTRTKGKTGAGDRGPLNDAKAFVEAMRNFIAAASAKSLIKNITTSLELCKKTATLVQERVSKTVNSNELRFEDKAGNEEIYIHAQKDANICVENDFTTTVAHDEHVTVMGQRNQMVAGNDSNEL